MTFKEFLKGYWFFLSRIVIFIALLTFIISPVILGLILGTFVALEFMWLLVLMLFTIPLGGFGIYKLGQSIFE